MQNSANKGDWSDLIWNGNSGLKKITEHSSRLSDLRVILGSLNKNQVSGPFLKPLLSLHSKTVTASGWRDDLSCVKVLFVDELI